VSPAKPSSDLESDREISPKLIVGTKKYGRRSRPTQNNDELVDETSDSDNEAASGEKKSSKVQRSVSQSDVHGTKRRRPLHVTKLKRCASLPSHKSTRLEIKIRQHKLTQELNEDSMDESEKLSALSQNLRAVWNSFETTNSDTLNFNQLEIVCERVGLHKIAAKLAAEEVFDKLSIKRDAGIRFDEFMNLIQSDSDMFSSVENIVKMEAKALEGDYQIISPTCMSEAGTMEMENLIELWTASNVPEPEELIKNLGFSGKEVKLSELCMVLEEEIQRQNTGEILSSLLRASLALHRSEITLLRQSYRQLADENRKLFTDNKEANRRALLLAQEIDERHSNIEDSTLSKIKQIELRHNETIKEITAQLAAEREHLVILNAKLETKVHGMESDEQKLRSDLTSLRDENSALEMEQTELHKQITELLEQNIKLNQDIAEMETGGDDGKLDSHNEEMLDLIEKIETLQMENSNLRDKNDELLCDVENLNIEVVRWKSKSKHSTSSDDQEATTSSAVKRRGDSPSKSKNVEESPRTGKVRKFSNDVEESDTSGDWMALNSELASSTPNVKVLAHKKHESAEVEILKKKVLELEEKVSEYKSKSEVTSDVEPSADDLKKIQKENEKLTNRVKELEDNLEQLSREYENCEDYWQAKVNEERILYDEDQRQSDEKFAELLQKMSELEDQFAAQTEKSNGRLSPIDEKCQLESQYLDLENEMEELKVHAQSILDEKSKEIEKLQLEVSVLQNQSGMKTPPRATSPDNLSVASSPINYLLNQNTITGPIRDYQNPNWVAKKMEMETTVDDQEQEEPTRVISPIQKPSTSSSQQQTTASIEPEISKEMQEVSEALSMISNRSIGSNSVHSLDGVTTPTSVNGAYESIKKMKMIMDQMKEEIQELATQRESLIMELQQLQEAKPILANAYVSFEMFKIIFFINTFIHFVENDSSEPCTEAREDADEEQTFAECFKATTALHRDDHVS
jgi:ninein